MYYEHFRLSGEPFSLTPDPAFLFLSEKHREAMAAVQYGLENGRGFITLIGEVGTGKTTILYSVLSQLGPEVAAAYVPYAAHTFDDLLTAALKDLGEKPPAGASRLDLLEILQQMLVRRDEAGQRTALVIDEAQSLADSTFEELRLLSNFETYTHKLLQIVLVGQPELQTRLRQQNLRQLQQRVSVRAIINPLDAAEMQAYILHRLKQVGADERLFEPAALRAIVRHARGHPAPGEHPLPQRAPLRVRPQPAGRHHGCRPRGHRRDGRACAGMAGPRNVAARLRTSELVVAAASWPRRGGCRGARRGGSAAARCRRIGECRPVGRRGCCGHAAAAPAAPAVAEPRSVRPSRRRPLPAAPVAAPSARGDPHRPHRSRSPTRTPRSPR